MTSRSFSLASSTEERSVDVELPIKGRRFQRSRHAEQQARSRSQDVGTSGFLDCAGGSRPLQKSKSVEMNLEKIAAPTGTHHRSNTDSVDVDKVAAAASGSRKVEKKGSFLFRSSSLLARLSGRAGQKKLHSPSPLRRDDECHDTSANHSDVTSSTLSKTTSFSETTADHGNVEVLRSPDSADVRSTATCSCRSEQTKQDLSEACRSPVVARTSPTRLLCRPVAAVSRETVLQGGERRRGLSRQMSEDWMTSRSRGAAEVPCTVGGQSKTTSKLMTGAQRMSTSAGNLLSRSTQLTEDSTSVTRASVSATATHCHDASLDAVVMTTTAAHLPHSEYSLHVGLHVTVSWSVCLSRSCTVLKR